jgi:hypothetical protein
MRSPVVGHALGVAGAVACLILAACGDASGPASNPARLRVVQGDGQTAPGGEPLLQPVVFGVTDGADRPVEGVAITFAVVAGGGSVPAAASVTGADGSAATEWTLGPAEEPQVLEARAAGVAAVRATAVVGRCAPADCPPTGSPILDAFELLTLGTYDHSGQVVHPDVAPLARIGGYPFWLGVTPYPNGNANFENPSIFQSANGRFWQVPAGLTNPVVRPASGYLSDPDVLFDTGDGRLWLYYRQVTGGANEILLTHSSDGLHWDAAEQVLRAPSHQIVSPTVVRGSPAAPWVMFSVNSGPDGCVARETTVERRTSTDGVHWSAPARTDLADPGQVPWHIDVQWIPARGEYWALYNTYPTGGTCTTDALRLARSRDGLHWTGSPSPVLRRGASAAFRDVVYRSSFAVDAASEYVTFWFSGASYATGNYVWRAATETRRVADVLAGAGQPVSAELLAAPIDLPPPEPADMPVRRRD